MPNERRAILLCLDLEAGSEELARKGAQYAKRLNLPLDLFYVLPQSSSESEEAALERLKGLAEATLEGTRIEALAVKRGNIEELIVDYIKEKNVDFIILGYRHKEKRERVYVGSTAKTIISLAPAPILVVPIDGNR